MKGRALNLTLRGRIGSAFRGTVLYTLGRAYNDTGGRDDLPPDSHDLSREWGRADFDHRHRFRVFGSFAMPKDMSLGAMFWASTGRPYGLTTGLDSNRDGMAIERPEGVPRNSLEQPGSATLNVRLSREFRLGGGNSKEGATMRLALDAFNALNAVDFTQIVGNLSSPFFGKPVAAGRARRLQVSLKLSF